MYPYLSRLKFYNIFIILLLTLSLFTISISDDSICTEQWTEINSSLENWSKKGDLKITESSEGTPIFTFGSTSNNEFLGLTWLNSDLSKNRGLKITFKSELFSYDENNFNSFPQGFAIVFTSSEPEKFFGGKNEGLGYEGIIKGIAFEFDFVQNEEKGDTDKPHFTVNYNINGILTSSSKDREDNLYNIELPNFYDNSKNDYDSNIYFEIKIYNKKIIVTSKSSIDKILLEEEFPQFQQLLENGDCSIGLTSSGNGDSGIIIRNLKIEEISMNKKGYFDIETAISDENNVPNAKAGERLTFIFYILSLCNEKLRIYSHEINSNEFKLRINEENIIPESIKYDENSNNVKIILTLNEAKLYTGIVEFNGYDSYPLQFIILPNDVSRIELCEHGKTEETKYYTTSIINQSKEYFFVPICVFDIFGNIKDVTADTIGNIKIKYPLNILPDERVDIIEDKINKRILVKIFFSTYGIYEIFCENFMNEKKRYVNLLPQYISPDKSQVSILYEQNIIQTDTSKIYLRIKLKDNYNRDIPVVTLNQLNCDFSESEVILKTESSSTNRYNVESQYKNDYVILSVDKPTINGNFLFIPKVKCTNIDLIQLNCDVNSVTKINNCEFFYLSETINVNTNYIKIFDEISEEYITFSKDNTQDYLYISLDEKDNKKLTDIILLDEQESNILSNTPQTITAILGTDTLIVTQIGNKYDLILPSDKTRYNYSPVKLYNLKITVNTDTIFNIKVKFYFTDKYMSNVDITQNDATKISYTAFYKQNSFTLEAQETLLLFEIYELSEEKYLANINSLDSSKVQVEINTVISTKCDIINHHNFFLSVICHDFTKAGEYAVSLKYNNNEIINKNIVIIPQSEAYFLANDDDNILDENDIIEITDQNLIKLKMLDKYENAINNNKIFNAFSKIKISDNNLFFLNLNYDGKIHIFNHGVIIGNSITLTLINGKTYTIESDYAPNFEYNLDQSNSYGILANEAPILEDNQDIKLNLYFRDKYGNYITGDIDKTKINVYIEGKNLINVQEMTSSQTSTLDGKIEYTANFGKAGDYLIKIFINNIPVECRGCHFRKNYISNEDYTKTSLYILGNKQKIQIFNSYSLSKKKVALFNKNNFFSFYLDQRDQYFNEIKKDNNDGTISLNFESETSGVDTSAIEFCETEKGYYELCENVFSSWKQLSDGIYLITNSILKYKFYIYLTNDLLDTDDVTPKTDNSFVYNQDMTLYGKLDAPASIVLDLRNSAYKRIKGLDKSKITIYNRNLKNIVAYVTQANEEGLFNILLVAQIPGYYYFYIQYNGKTVINGYFTYICNCGSDVVLKPGGSDFLPNGNYAFFNFIDSKGNECNIPYNWNIMNEKNFANFILKAKKDDDKNYKTETYYNHITNTLIVYLENYVTEQVMFYSNLFKFYYDEDYILMDLIENIIDENHFYASINHEDNILNIKSLNANYEPAFNCYLVDNDIYFNIVLIRIINDDFIILKNDYEIIDDYCEVNVELDDSLIDAKGKYLYIVYYQGKEIYCENCMINSELNNIDMSKTKVFHKEGDYQYYQSDENSILPLFKSNLPFFKVNIMSEGNNLVILENGLNVELKTVNDDDTSIITMDTGVKYSSNGNVYIYLKTAEDRKKFWSLDTMQKIKLSISYEDNAYTTSYYVMEHYVKRLRSYENCDTTLAPLIINQQELYIKRYDEDLELEIRLSNCMKDNSEILENIKVFDSEGLNQFNAELIPSDILGSYYLFLPKNLEVNNSKKYYILNKYNIKSSEFELSIMPGYDIGKIEFKKDENMDESGGDKIYTYFLVKIQDKYNNIITNVGRNLFVNDIFAFSLNNIPYRLSYDEKLKMFRCQVPIFTSAELEARSLISEATFNIDIEIPKVYKKALVTLDSELNNKFTFTFELKDDVYNDVESEEYISDVSFKYITINPITEQIFVKEIASTHLGQNKFSVELDNSYPKYSFYGFIPYIQFFQQICPSCMVKNSYPNNIYLLNGYSNFKYEPHNINKNIYLMKNYENPTFLYWAHADISIESSDANVKEIYNTNNIKIYYIEYSGQNENMNIQFYTLQEDTNNNLASFTAQFLDYDSISSENNIPSYVEVYGDSIFSPNLGDTKYITFFIETRDDTGKLYSTKPNLYKDESFSNLIESIQIINTCYTGVFYVQIKFAKSGNLEYYLKFSETQTKTNNDSIINIHSIPSFPTYLSLENKEVVNKNNIKFSLYTHNDHNEAVCDERLNIYMEDMNLKGSHITLDSYKNKCELYIIFGGYATIKSNINNYITEVNNNDKSLYNISPQFSKLSLIPNIFNSDEESLNVKFIEKSPSKNAYGINEVNSDKTLMIYKYISPNKIQLINSLTSLSSNEYIFNPKNMGIIDRGIYILVGSVVDSTLNPIFAYFQPEKASNNDIKGIEAIYFNDDQRYNVLTNFMLNKVYSGETLQLTLPLLLRIKFLDEKGNDLDISPEEGNKYCVKLILSNDEEEKISKNLIIRQFNDKYFYIQIDPSDTVNIKHLPIYLTDNNLRYFIKITYDSTISLYSLLSLEKRNYIQSPSIKKRYTYSESNTVTSFEIYTDLFENTISIPDGNSNINHICLYITDSSEKVILNQYLDLSNAIININDCSDFKYANSYMGCFELYVNCPRPEGVDMRLSVKYNSIDSSNQISINIININSMNFNLQNGQSTTEVIYTGDATQAQANLYFTTNFNSLSIELFKFFINGEKIENTQISNPEGITNVLNFVIPYKYFDTIQKTKNIMILYADGSNIQKSLLSQEYSIIVNQKDYENSLVNSYYIFQIQDPLNLKVGENIYLYLLIYDKNKACYYGDFDKLSNIEIKLKIENDIYTKNIKSREKIEGYSQCEYIYLVDFEQMAKKAGDFDITIKDGEKEYQSKIHISPNDIDETKSYFQGENSEVQAGDNIYLTFVGTDSEGNVIDFYDIINDLDIVLYDSNGEEVDKNGGNYIYELKVNSENDALILLLKINNLGTYSIKMLKKGEIMNLPEYRISIQPLECSAFDPELTLLPIDNRQEYYIKEKIIIKIKCKDIYGNHVKTKGNELFKAYVIKENENTDNDIYDFDEYFKDEYHYIPLYVEEPGNYILDVTLNGKKYIEGINLEIKPIDSSKYNCMDKTQVENLEDCDTENYRNYIKEILGESNICYSSTIKGVLYKCNPTDTECVSHTNQCQCQNGISWQGYCYPNGFNPIEQVSNNLVTCISKITNAVSCGDGSCRYNHDECITMFECPIGYKPCGVKCILLNQICNVNIINCNNDEVLCWDLSCAQSYDNCPTRITCPKNKVLCPDGSCQVSGHCIQPPNRNCDDNEFQCNDFSCVSNRDLCPINIICEPGLSLCENKTCNQYCKDTSDDINPKNDDTNNEKNNSALIGGLVGGIGGGLILGFTAFYFFYLRKRRSLGKNEGESMSTGKPNINIEKNKENIKVYNKNDALKENGETNEINEIKSEKEDINKESTNAFRSIRNIK